MQSTNEIIKRYRQKGHRITPQRRIIFETLTNDETHPTAEDVFQRVKSKLPEISLATVYNTMNELVDMGILQKVKEVNQAGARYDTEISPHHHLYCVRCKKLQDIGPNLGPYELPDEVPGFQVLRTQVTFYGVCSECQEMEGNN